jgi:hypothetical protein
MAHLAIKGSAPLRPPHNAMFGLVKPQNSAFRHDADTSILNMRLVHVTGTPDRITSTLHIALGDGQFATLTVYELF